MKDSKFWERVRHYAARRAFLTGKKVVQEFKRLSGSVDGGRKYVFVAGVQRSGTNMMMDVLGRSFECDVYHETDPRAFDNYQMRDRNVIHGLAERSLAPVFVIKALCELQELRSLMDEFLPAQVIWIMRHYEDVVNSILVSFQNRVQAIQNVIAHRGDDSWWLWRGVSDETYTVLKSLVHPEMNEASAAALQWYLRNILFFEQGLDKDRRVLAVSYERLVKDPYEQFRQVFAFLGLKYSPRLVRQVFANSVRRRAPPEIEPRVKALCEDLSERIAGVVTAGEMRYE